MNSPMRPNGNAKLDLENLVAEWGYATTHRERSRIEGLLWELAPSEVRKDGSAKWLNRMLGAPIQPTEARLTMRRQGEASDALWQRVDGPERMLVHTAGSVMRRAKVRAEG